MAKNAAIGATGPLGYLDSDGTQKTVPLSALSFENGTLTGPAGVPTAWLKYLSDTGLLTPAPTPAPATALVVTAKHAGSAGNDIRIAIADDRPDPGDSTKTIFDATLTQADAYDGLTVDTLADVLGSAASWTSGSRPGLVYVSSGGTPVLPAEGTYAASASGVVTVTKKSGSGTAFKLHFRPDVTDATAEVVVSSVDETAGTFALQATWSKEADGIHRGELQSSFSDFIVVTGPDGGSITEDPAEGTIVLAGGSDTADSTAASASVVGG